MAPRDGATYSDSNALKAMWAWLTGNGDHDPDVDPPNVDATGTTSLAKNEDAVHVSGDPGIQMLAVRQDAAAALAAAGDYIPLIVDASGRLWVNTEHPDVAALADNTANPTVSGAAAYLMEFDGTTWDRWRDPHRVEGTPTHTPDNSVTNVSETILSANANRKAAYIQVVSGGNARVTIDGQTATPTLGIQVVAGGPPLTLSSPFCGVADIKAIREGATDAVIQVVEIV